MALSDYEQREWDRLQARKNLALQKQAGHLLPAVARDQVAKAAKAVRSTQAAEIAADAYASVASELGKVIGGAASHTVSNEAVVKKFNAAGHHLDSLNDILLLDLKSVDSVARLGTIRWGHSGAAAAVGFGSAAAITGGTVWAAKGTVHDEGAKQAPGIGVVAGAYAGDLIFVLGAAARAVASTARYYGFDPQRREEQVFMMSVIGLGMATGGPAKTAAYAELSQLTQLLFRDATWATLNEKVLTKIAQQFANKFSVKLTKKKLGQFVPVAGVVVGAGLNFGLIDKVASAANDAYRERFLIEKSGGTLSGFDSAGVPVPPAEDDDYDLIGMLSDENALPDPNYEVGEPEADDGKPT